MRQELPSGQVTLLFTDVEGSTQLLHEVGPERYAELLAEHRRVVRAALAAEGGVEVDTQGDAFFVAFPSAAGAVAAAQAAQAALAAGPIRVRMGLHTGVPHLAAEGYVGEDVHLGARIGAAGHGGQVLLSAATRALVDVEATDLGEHRLKDFAVPVAIFQLGRDPFPPLKTISNTNLPRPASSFVGRRREVAEVAALLRGEDRLVTLTGPGGSGKTRLALEAAADVVGEFKAGVFWVGLAPVRDPALVLDEIGQTLGTKGDVAAAVGDRELLLLLDNLEQVIDAASALSSLLRACPHLRLLVTSRELLRIDGEAEYPVSPLASDEAVELFCTRGGVDADETVGRLCARLDNLPLAVELAAARVRALTPAQILERLARRLDLLRGGRDADPRQQTLRATIAWSHDLLGDEERTLFARLGVFAGGCTLETAEAVAGADLDVLQSLVEKSLVRHTGDRFWLLETIREFALEQLEGSGERAEVERRFAEHYLALAEEAFPNLKTHAEPWLDRLEAEHDNLRAALDRAEAGGDVRLAFAIAGQVYPFWYLRGYLREGRVRVERLLALDEQSTTERANALLGLVSLTIATGDPERAGALAEEALALQERLGDPWRQAYARFVTGAAAIDRRDYSLGARIMARSEAEFRDLGDDYYERLSLANRGYCFQELGRLGEARACFEAVIELAAAAGDEAARAGAYGQLGSIARKEESYPEAFAFVSTSLRIWSRLGNRLQIGRDLGRLAYASAKSGRYENAAMLHAAHVAMRESTGAMESWYGEQDEELLGLVRGALDEAVFERASAKGSTMTVDDALALVTDVTARPCEPADPS